jgi:hypothetical protein
LKLLGKSDRLGRRVAAKATATARGGSARAGARRPADQFVITRVD